MDTSTIKIKEYDDGEIGFDMCDVLKGMTTRESTVKFYSMKTVGKTIELTLYNKNKRKIKLKRKKL